MCGIAGFALGPDSSTRVERESLVAMSRALLHRGPDDEGFYFSAGVGLASRRLSIIDLSTSGRMPLFNETGTVAVIQNGEIYNYRELRKHLMQKGHIFRSATDTEVIVHLYEEYGQDFVEKLEGMFSIALWDLSKKELLLARDRFGEKPLYYFEARGGIAFASELRSLCFFPEFCRELDWDALDQFLTLGYILAPRSPYLQTSKLLPGHLVVFRQSSGEFLHHCYWSPPTVREPENLRSDASYLEEFEELFSRIVHSRLVSDVPVGAFLSGGIDSSLVVAAISRIKNGPLHTFSIGFGDSQSNDENPIAESVAQSLGVIHRSVEIEFKDFKKLLGRWPDLCDEPLGDPAYVGVHLISKLAKESGITVMVSGDGGDELFGGYPIFQWVKKLSRVYNSPSLTRWMSAFALHFGSMITGDSRWEKAQCAMRQPRLVDAAYYLTGHGAWSIHELGRLKHIPGFSVHNESFVRAFGNESSGRSLEDRIYKALLQTYLPDNNLARMDRSSMANSVETRAPFLHPELAEFAAQLPMNMKCRGSVLKYILRQSLAKQVPLDVWQRAKRGFNALPMGQWMKSELNFLTDDYLNRDSLKRQGIFDDNMIAELMAQHRAGGQFNHWWKLWLLLVLQIWLERWGKPPVAVISFNDGDLPALAFEAPA